MDYKDFDVQIGEKDFAGGIRGMTATSIIRTRSMYTVAGMATDIATRLALVAAIPDGEDSAGRQKLRLPTAEELTQRACDIAASLWAQFEERGWLFDVPLPEKIEKKARSAADREEETTL